MMHGDSGTWKRRNRRGMPDDLKLKERRETL